MLPKIVFLDRDTLDAKVRRPSFTHDWLEYGATTPDQVVDRLRDATIVITNKVPITAQMLTQLPSLKMIALAATGYNIIDIVACHERSVVVSNIRHYANASLPEHVFALILALRRQILSYHRDVQAGKWQQAKHFCFLHHPILDLANSQLGIIGYGTLGQSIAKIARGFGMRIKAAVSLSDKVSAENPSTDDIERISLDELLRTSDVITLNIPMSAQTRNLIDAPQLALMKPTALLINTARGGLVNEAALAQALREGQIGGAGFDVLTVEPPTKGNPLLEANLPNFILTPHIAWASQGAMQTLADQLIDNIEAFVNGQARNTI